MAHSANVLGQYIVVFGGYNSQSQQYSPNNLYVLSLAGCTDYILSKPYTLKMVKQANSLKFCEIQAAENLKIQIDMNNAEKKQIKKSSNTASLQITSGGGKASVGKETTFTPKKV